MRKKAMKVGSFVLSATVLLAGFMTAIVALGCGVPVWLVSLTVGIPVLGFAIAR